MFKIGNTHFIGWLWNELMLCKAWVSNLWASDGKGLWPIRNWAAQHEVSLNVMHLNHPETIPIPYPQSVEKLSSTKLVPGTKNAGDHWYKGFIFSPLLYGLTTQKPALGGHNSLALYQGLHSLTELCPLSLTPVPAISAAAKLHCSLFFEG